MPFTADGWSHDHSFYCHCYFYLPGRIGFHCQQNWFTCSLVCGENYKQEKMQRWKTFPELETQAATRRWVKKCHVDGGESWADSKYFRWVKPKLDSMTETFSKLLASIPDFYSHSPDGEALQWCPPIQDTIASVLLPTDDDSRPWADQLCPVFRLLPLRNSTGEDDIPWNGLLSEWNTKWCVFVSTF